MGRMTKQADEMAVYVVDDHDAVRWALVMALRAAPDVRVVGDAADADQALAEIAQRQPNVVLIETKRHDGRGLDLVEQIAQSAPAPRVVVLTSYPSEWEWWMAQRAGAVEYLLKDISATGLLDAVRALFTRPE